jgi:hypothetical protein
MAVRYINWQSIKNLDEVGMKPAILALPADAFPIKAGSTAIAGSERSYH